MRRRARVLALLICLAVISPTAIGIVDASSNSVQIGDPVTVEGVSVEMQPKSERAKLQKIQQALEPLGVTVPSNAFSLFHETGSPLVLTTNTPETGIARVSGTRLSADRIPGIDSAVIIADSVQFRTDGAQADWQSVRNNPQQYSFELVEVTVPARQGSFISEADPKTVVGRPRVVKIGSVSQWQMTRPGHRARTRLRQLAQSDAQPMNVLGAQLGTGTPVLDYRGTAFWVHDRVRLDIAIIALDGQLYAFLAHSTPVAKTVPSVSTIEGSSNTGQTVRVTANTVGVRISVQELLLKTAKCAPQSVTFPGLGCIPLPVDATIHTGVAYQLQNGTSMVPYVGVSNSRQTKPVTIDRGYYRLAGRVVHTEQLHSTLPPRTGLILYEQQRKGGLRRSAPRQVQTQKEQMSTAMKSSARGTEPSFTHQTSTPAKTKATASTDRSQATDTATPVPHQQQFSSESGTQQGGPRVPFQSVSQIIAITAGLGAIILFISSIVLSAYRGWAHATGRFVDLGPEDEAALMFGSAVFGGVALIAVNQIVAATGIMLVVGGSSALSYLRSRSGSIIAVTTGDQSSSWSRLSRISTVVTVGILVLLVPVGIFPQNASTVYYLIAGVLWVVTAITGVLASVKTLFRGEEAVNMTSMHLLGIASAGSLFATVGFLVSGPGGPELVAGLLLIFCLPGMLAIAIGAEYLYEWL